MNNEQAIHCLRVYTDESVCEECDFYPDCTHETQSDMSRLAISALEKQIARKPIMKPYFEDMNEEYLCCPTCGEILTDRILGENKKFYFHCLNCGQKFDWED